MQLKNQKLSTTVPTDKSPAILSCTHQLQIQQIQQQQRCSSVGSTGSSTCDTLSSHSGSALSPTLPPSNGYLSKNIPGNSIALAATLSGAPSDKIASSALSTLPLRGMAASRMPLNASQSDPIYPTATLPTALSTLPLLPPPPPPLAASATASGASTALNVGNIGVSAAAAMAAANLAESFTLLQQHAAHHFQDILYAAHLLGRGYYQPAGPLISPHVLPPVATGPPPPLANVSLLPATTTTTAGSASSKKHPHQQQIPTPLGSDPEHLHPAPPSTTSAADSTDSDVLITGGDLTPFRYPATGAVPPHHPASPQQQQQHQLHQQAAAAAAAHQGNPYPRSMHAAQMHYLTAYPPNYYAPYPGEAMCYSPPTAAYQPYFPTKVYQSGPPHPPPAAYRRYPYYQPGPPPPAELYEPAPPPPTSSSGSGGQQSVGPPTQGASQAPPPQSTTGSQLVPAGPAAHTQHLEHYPGPPGYYSGYSPGSTAAGQCYTRSIQGPYMEYPPQCPCPMQQSCPKNVHTGPHIGSNNGNPNNSSNTTSINSNSGSGSNTTAMNHSSSNNNSNLIVNGIQNHHHHHNNNNSSSNNMKSTNSTTNNHTLTNANSNNKNSSHTTTNTVSTNRGPVKNVPTQQLQQQEDEMDKFVDSYHERDLLNTPVKSELKTEDSDCKSQYEEHVVQPPTPPESYGTNDDKSLLIDDDIIDEAMEKLEMSRIAAEAAAAVASVPTSTATTLSSQHNSTITTSSPELVPTMIEAYDLTTTITPPLVTAKASAVLSSNSNVNVTNSRPSTQPPLVGRKARIGKTMAREMVYAAAATAPATVTPQHQHQQQHQHQPLIQVRNLPQQHAVTNIPTATTQATLTTATAVMTTTGAPTITTTLPLLTTIKTEIKAEHIKMEDDIMDSILRQQHISSNSNSSNHDQNELKIKAEPLSSPEGEMNSSHTPVYDIISRIKPNRHEATKFTVDQQLQQESIDVVDNSTISMPKPISEGRMRLLTSWEKTPKVNCEIDLSTVSDDDVLDLCQSPMPGNNSSKRIKILDFQNAPGTCKKSSPNSYKSLIKQAEPKAYLCSSRMDKRGRYSILRRKTVTNGSVKVRRRHVVLTEQQRERLKLRKKKQIALERKRQEALEKKRAAYRKRKIEAKQAEKERALEKQSKMEANDLHWGTDTSTTSKDSTLDIENTMLSALQQRQQETLKTSPKHTIKPKKSSAIPLHTLETTDAGARGYFSEPETRCCSVLGSNFGCENDSSARRTTSIAKSSLAEVNCRKQKKSKMSIAEKRSKSETKKPIKGSTGSTTFLNDTRDVSSKTNTLAINTSKQLVDEAIIRTPDDSPTHANAEVSPTIPNKPGKTKKQKESKSKSKNETKSSKLSKSKLKKALKPNKKQKTSNNDVAMNVLPMESIEKDFIVSAENSDQTIPRETNNNEIIEKPSTLIDTPNQTLAEQTLLTDATDILEKKKASLSEQSEITETNTILQTEKFEPSSVAATSHSDKAQVFLQPSLPPRILCHSHHYHGKRTRSRAKFGPRKRQKQKHSTVSFELDERPPPALRGDVAPKWNNGWTWEGEPFQGAVFLNSDDPLVIRTCYAAMRHSEGDIIRTRDCVLLKANEDNELPYVAKVAHLWENPEDGEMMVSLLWYYRPEHTEQGRQPSDSPDEVYASRHRDHNSVACIEDKCYVLTFSEYCRYRRRLRAAEEDIEDSSIVPKPASSFYSTQKVPDNTNPELVMFCRRAYEFRMKRLLKMPKKQDYYVVSG